MKALGHGAATVPARAWTRVRWTGPGGGPVNLSALHALLFQLKGATATTSALQARLARRGYTEWISYQPGEPVLALPAHRGRWLLALALLLGAATVWLVRHRAA